jgi:tetratricopeptide (TPR) repeat protein
LVDAECPPFAIHTNLAIDTDTRASIQLAAVTAYTTALSHSPSTLEAYYHLALQYARQRSIEKSISALSQALHLNKLHIPSIHLLTLLLTALEDYEKALQTCHTVKLDGAEQLSLDDAVALLELQLTYLRIVEVVSGRDLALEVQKGIFKLYHRIFGPTKPSRPTTKSTPEVMVRPATATEHSLRRTRSNLNTEKNTLQRSLDNESKLSFQAPSTAGSRMSRTRSLLKRRRRSRSVDNYSTTYVSEKPSFEQRTADRPSFNTELRPESPPPVPGIPSSLSTDSIQVSKLVSPQTTTLANRYRAKLWLACAGIYRRAGEWEGAQAAIQDALLTDSSHDEVFTEVVPTPQTQTNSSWDDYISTRGNIPKR